MKSMMNRKAVEKDGRMLGSSSGGESYGLISKNDEMAPRAAANKHSLRLNEAVAPNDSESPERRRSQESMS
jgi:serine/threonine protein phosphatase PrpC